LLKNQYLELFNVKSVGIHVLWISCDGRLLLILRVTYLFIFVNLVT